MIILDYNFNFVVWKLEWVSFFFKEATKAFRLCEIYANPRIISDTLIVSFCDASVNQFKDRNAKHT